MKQFIITYEDNFDFALTTKIIMNKEYDLDPEIIVGHTVSEKYSRTEVIMYNWIDFILPKAIEYGEDIIVYEDDVRLTQPIHDLPFLDNDIVWFGFRRGRLEHKRQTITGTQAMFFKKEVLQDIYDNFCSYKKKIQIDNGMSKFCVKFSKKYNIYQPKLSFCYEKEHESLISLDKWDQYTKPRNNRNS